ncbi:DUF721 domain-containing protein [bacterium]|nr:DUF721 domain-containing protein [bacterium]
MSNYNYYQTNTRFTSQEKKERNKFYRFSKKRSLLAREVSFNTIKDYFKSEKIDKYQKTNFWLVTKLNDHWLKICGTILYPHLRIHELRGRKLILIAQSGIWLQQAKFLERELLKKIKIVLPSIILESIDIEVRWFQTSKSKVKKKSKFPERIKSEDIQFKNKKTKVDISHMSLKQKMDYMLNKDLT